MAEIANAWISIVPETSKIAPGVKKALGEIEAPAAKAGESMGSKMSSTLGKTLKAGAIGAGASVAGVLAGSLAKGFTRINALDQAEAKFKGLGVTGDQLTRSMESVNKSVKGTSFGLDEAAGSAAKLSAVGVKTGSELDRAMKLTADIAAQAGTGMDDVSSIMAKVAGAGKLTGETLAQLDERATGAGAALSKHLGMSIDEVRDKVSKGEIDFATFQEAMEKHLGGAAQKTGETIMGSFNNMKAAAGRFGATMLGSVASSAPAMMSSIGTVFDSMGDAIKPSMEQLGTTLTPAFERLGNVIETKIAPAAGAAAKAVGEFIAELADKGVNSDLWGQLGDSMGKIGSAAAQAWPSISSLLQSFGQLAATISVATWQALADVLNALAPVISGVVAPALQQLAHIAADNPAAVQAFVTAWLGMKAIGTVAGPVGKTVGVLKNLSGAAGFAKAALSGGGGIGGAIIKLAGGVGSANPVIAKLGAVATKAGSGLVSLGNMGAKIGPVLSRVGGVVKTLGSALGSGLVSAAKLAAGAFRALGMAMVANPIGAIVAAIAAVVAALVWFFTKTETGKQAWQSFMTFLSTAWEWIKATAVAVWQGIADFFTGLWEGISNAAMLAWQIITAFLQAAWDNIVLIATTVWQGIVDFFTGLWEGITATMTAVWTGITATLQALWTGISTVASTIWNGIVNTIRALWDGLTGFFSAAAGVIGSILSAAWNGLKAVASAIWGGIVAVVTGLWNGMVNTVRAVWNGLSNALSAGFNFVKNLASTVWNAIKSVITNAINGAKNGVSNAADGIKNAISNMVNSAKNKFNEFVGKVQEIPGKIKSAFSNAGSWLLDAGRNLISGFADGIRGAAGWITDAIKSLVPGSLHRFLPFMDGGFFFANGGVENHQAQIARGGAWRVWAEPETGGEAYIPLAQSKRERSTRILATVADRFGLSLTGRDGQPLAAASRREVRPTGQFFADGGITTPDDLLRFARGERVNGKQAARSLEGASYVWGGSNWGDCSGAQSQLAAAVSNAANWFTRKFATMSQGAWLSQNGFKSGLGSGPRFATGFFNGGPYGGHTGGTIFFGNGKRVNVEMGGGRGNGQIAGAAAGADHSQFTSRYHYPLKSQVVPGQSRGVQVQSTSVNGMTVSTPEYKNAQIDWGEANELFNAVRKDQERNKKLARFHTGVFDTGGVLKHNGMAINLSGKPEVVVNNNQLTAINKLANNVGALVPEIAALARSNQLGGAARALASTVRTGDFVAAAGLNEKSALVGAAKQLHVVFGNVIEMAVSMKPGDYISLGEKLGLNIFTDFAKGTVSAYTALEDSWVKQVDAADGVKQAEVNLTKARKNYADVVKKDGAKSEAAKAAKEELTAAELDLADARSVVKAAAAATGHAEIAMAVEVFTMVTKIVDAIAGAVTGAIAQVRKAVASMMGAMSELAEMTVKQRNLVTGLRLDMALTQVKVAESLRKLRIAQIDGATAQLESAVTVAEAQAKFDAQRRADAALALADYTDLSLAFDRFRWNVREGLTESMAEMAAWSDESHALYAELMAAQIGQQMAEKQAQISGLKAAYDHTKAVLDLAEVTRSLGVASEKLAVLTGTAFGYDTVEASVGKRYADLAAEKAQITADQASIKNWLNPAAWFTYYPQAARRMEQIDAEMAEISAMPEFKAFDPATLKQINSMIAGAGALGFFGGADSVGKTIDLSALGDAGRALEKVKWSNDLIDTKAEQEKLRADIAEKQAELDYESALSPLETLLESLKASQASEKAWAEYWRSDNDAVREALKTLAEFQANSATGLREMASNNTTVNITLPADKTAYTPAEVEAMLATMNKELAGADIRISRLENPPTSGLSVADSRKGR